ncbi:MAG TPA: hypothetical protein VM345_14840 [Acidimicrobiales bacterium]|jgi:hypothetical protein|nr:hypothetical protein [Acidimicrobiales bacterium]
MRKALTAVALLGALLAGLVSTSMPAGAAGVVDLATTIESNPGTVSPAGALVRYVATFSNTSDSLVTSDAQASVTTTGGGTFVSLSGDSAGCSVTSASNPEVSCSFTLAPGASRTVNLVVQTPTTPGSMTATSSVNTTPNVLTVVPDVNQANNSAVVTTTVTNPTTGSSSAFLREGETLQYKAHTMTVIATYGSANGVVATMRDSVVSPGTQCGDKACSPEGLFYDFDPRPEYKGRVQIDVDFVGDDPCFGKGNPDCYVLYYRLTSTETPKPVESCTVVPTTSPAPCLRSVTKTGRGFIWRVEANTNDPDLLSPISGVKL